jgi:hypothetical protein
MSRYSIGGHDPQLLVVVGFDPPLETFFVQVDDYRKDDEEDHCLCWRGTSPGELSTVAALEEVVRPYATLAEEVRAKLQQDYDHREPPTPLQQDMIRLLQQPRSRDIRRESL